MTQLFTEKPLSHETPPVDFKLKQVATRVPKENVQDVQVTRYDDLLFVSMDDGWVRINLADGTFAVGAYEG